MSEQQQEYGGIIINGIDCSGGGGSSVTPNPPAPATETLSSLDINGVVYSIEQETRENIFSIFDTSNKNSRCSDGELTPGESFWFEIDDPDPNTDWSGSMTIYNNNAYDLTGIDKLELVVDISQQSDYSYLWLTFSDTKYTWGSSSWPGVYQNKTSALQISQSGSYEVDVSNLTGSYYIYVGATSGKDSVAPGDCNNTHNGYIKGTVTAFNIISTSSGTEVIPNPSGTATDTLEKLQIENTIYDFDTGTEVIANPTGAATADLNKISIGGIIYNIVNGGSGGGNSFESTTLYTGTQRDNIINLSDDYTNYDYLVLQGYATVSPGFLNSNLISVNDITIGNNIGISDDTSFIWYTITDTDEFTFSGASGTYYIKAIYGLKESEGGGYLTLVPCYAEFIEGFNNTYWNTHLGQLNAEYFLDFYIDQYQNDRSILGSSGGPGRLHLTMYSNKWYTSTGNSETSFGDSTMITGRHTFRWNTISDSKILFDEQDTGLTCSQSEVKDINIYINNRSARGTNDTCTNSRIYEFKITAKDGTVLHDFKPYALYAGSTLIWKGIMDVVGGMEADGWFNVKEISGSGTILVGADIEPNSEEEPTDTLENIKIDDTVYQITSCKEKTTAAYYDIPEEIRNTDNVLYAITDDGIHLGDTFSPVIYSTEEREIGVWTDNKPLYQKSIVLSSEITVSNNDWTSTGITASSLDIETYVRCSAQNSSGTCWDAINVATINSNISLTAWRNGDTIGVKEFTIQYTKTTDVAGSGSYNTLGVPTVHYTTDEQVIGTWVDGKPLYRKTVTYTGVSGARNSLDLNIANVDFINLVPEGSCADNRPLPYVTGTDNSNNIGGFFDVQTSTTTFEWRAGSGSTSSTDVILTVQYTKTTD